MTEEIEQKVIKLEPEESETNLFITTQRYLVLSNDIKEEVDYNSSNYHLDNHNPNFPDRGKSDSFHCDNNMLNNDLKQEENEEFCDEDVNNTDCLDKNDTQYEHKNGNIPTVSTSRSIEFNPKKCQKDESNLKYQCDQCDFTTKWRNSLKVHSAKHEGTMYKCDKCNFTAYNKDNLTIHYAKHKGVIYNCDKCDYSTIWKGSLKLHCAKHTGIMYKCEECNYSTKTRSGLTLHIAKHKGIVYKCDQCDYSTHRKHDLKAHCVNHKGTKYKCSKCDFVTKWKRNLTTHSVQHYVQAIQTNEIEPSRSFSDVSDIDDPTYCPSEEPASTGKISVFVDEASEYTDKNQHEILEATVNNVAVVPLSANIRSDSSTSAKIDEDYQAKKCSVFCYFCRSYVIHFPRHLIRKHTSEVEVQKLSACPPRSKERNKILFDLRKKGNYVKCNTVSKPVRKGAIDSNYLPCSYCLGFYSTKNLWRHRKQCDSNPNKGEAQKFAQAHGQNMLLRDLRIDSQLMSTVFPRMRADHISLVAKKDALICAFASRYLKIHRESHFVRVASVKMRELARLLQEVKKLKPSILTLFDALKPTNYDILVSATKSVSKYDHTTQSYKSPGVAINMGRTLRQCCDIALKKPAIHPSVQSATIEAELKALVQLIEDNWKCDVSGQALTNLNIKKWNKVTLVPLAGDLKLLKDYLISKANEASTKLEKNNGDKMAYITLLETVYSRLSLLNRCRSGELQRLPVDVYKSTLTTENSQSYDEFSETVSEAQKFLTNSFKRIVIKDKRNKGVPVLISEDVREHLNIILKCRQNIITDTNIYLFAKPNSSEPIIGYKVLKKYATLCKAKNADALTCMRFRKHVATLTQLLHLSENRMEELSFVMGHKLGVHQSSYRLPDDIYQTAKISKLLILREKGKADHLKGKTLNELNLDMEEDLMKETEVETHDPEIVEEDIFQAGNRLPTANRSLKDKGNILSKKRVIVPWTDEQKRVVNTYFKNHIAQKRAPKLKECEKLISQNTELLQNKSWIKIKVFIQNQYRKMK